MHKINLYYYTNAENNKLHKIDVDYYTNARKVAKALFIKRIYGDTNQELYMPYAAKNYLTTHIPGVSVPVKSTK